MASKGAQASFWRAISSLREAETLAALAAVSGPADEPPAAGAEQSWVDDYAKRAGRALAKAREWAGSSSRSLKERAGRVAARVREGIREVYRASPAGRASQTLRDLSSAANAITLASAFGSVVLTAGLLYLAYQLFLKKGQ